MEITIKATPNEAAEFFRTLEDYRGGVSLTKNDITIDASKITAGTMTGGTVVRSEDSGKIDY